MLKLQDYQALLFDVDRTLTTTKHQLPDSVIQKLKQIAQMGFEVGVCTGRGFPTVHNYILPNFPDNSLHILNGGGEISTSTGELIYEKPIPSNLIRPIIDFVTKKSEKSFLSTHDYLFGADKFIEDYQNHPWQFKAKPMSQYQDENVTLICIMNITEDNISEVPGANQLNVKFMTSNEGKSYIDITAKDTNKATALEAWSKQTNIPLNKVIGFGDSPNDLEFLEKVGFGVAMGNADDKVKKIADKIIGHTDENGLSNYLAEIISGKEL